jgi:hypothetical protein
MLHERAISKGSIVIKARRIIFLSLLDMKDDELMSKTIRIEKKRKETQEHMLKQKKEASTMNKSQLKCRL